VTGEPQVPAPPAVQTTNTMAVASLILGVLWFAGLGSILAIVFGARAKSEIAASRGAQGGEGLATAGIVLGILGLVVPLFALFAVCAGSTDLGGGRVSSLDRAGFVLDVTSELESAAAAEESFYEEDGTYTGDLGQIRHDEYVGVTLTIVSADESGFCLEGTHDDLNSTWHITEDMRRATRGSCP
jgi:Domain of unknown function (DUF4190)